MIGLVGLVVSMVWWFDGFDALVIWMVLVVWMAWRYKWFGNTDDLVIWVIW